MDQLALSFLGSFQIRLNGALIEEFGTDKARGLFAFLAVETDQPHRRTRLAGLLWPDMPETRALRNLNQALYNIRQALKERYRNPAFILSSHAAIQFNPTSSYQLDVSALSDRLKAIHSHNHPGLDNCVPCIEQLRQAVSLYRGDFLGGFSLGDCQEFDEWILVTRERLHRMALEALHQLSDHYERTGELTLALQHARRQVEIDPIDERACRQFMRLLAANHQRNQALKHFERFQVMLTEELNVEPEEEILALRDQILSEEAGRATDQIGIDNLPAFLTPMIGRGKELAELQTLILRADCRLLTILGPGGIGKTRLALEAAKYCREKFPQGVFFVPLNSVQSPESILPTIADVLDLPRGGHEDIRVQLSNYLRRKNILLLLDGLEHLLEGIHLLVELLHHALGLKILVTSRARLNIKGEFRYMLSGMHVPAHYAPKDEILKSDAVQLLVSGLQQARPDHQPELDDIQFLQQICEKVQGMPLGILLAASWGGSLSVAEINSEINRGLDFLAADWVDVPARQRSLRATFDHTWLLLGKREQTIFQSLAVFRGSFTRRAAQVVSGASPKEIRALVDRSLLLIKTPGWFEIHELLRQYGREKLAEEEEVEEDVCDRHSAYYLEQMTRLGDELKGAKQVTGLANIDLEHANYRAAWNWAASQGAVSRIGKVLNAFCLYYDLSLRYPDGESACRVAVEGFSHIQSDPDVQLIRARIFSWWGRFARVQGQSETACQHLEQARIQLEKAERMVGLTPTVEAFFYLEKGNTYFYKDRNAAAGCYQYSLNLCRSLDDTWGTAKVLSRLGSLAYHTGSFEDAVKYYSESLELFKQTGDPRGIANALVELGNNSLRQGKIIEGQRYIEEGVLVQQKIGDRAGVVRNYIALGRSCFYTGQFARGNKMWKEKLFPILEDLGMHSELVYSTPALGLGLAHNGEYTDAIEQASNGLRLAEEIDARREIGLASLMLGIAYLGLRDFEQVHKWALKSINQYQEIDQRDELAWAFSLMVFIQRNSGKTASAMSYLHQTLEIGIETHGYFPVLCGLCGASLLLLDQDEIRNAVELKALTWCFPVAAKSQWFEDVAGREIDAAAKTLPSEEVTAVNDRGRKRDLWETANELLEKFSK